MDADIPGPSFLTAFHRYYIHFVRKHMIDRPYPWSQICKFIESHFDPETNAHGGDYEWINQEGVIQTILMLKGGSRNLLFCTSPNLKKLFSITYASSFQRIDYKVTIDLFKLYLRDPHVRSVSFACEQQCPQGLMIEMEKNHIFRNTSVRTTTFEEYSPEPPPRRKLPARTVRATRETKIPAQSANSNDNCLAPDGGSDLAEPRQQTCSFVPPSTQPNPDPTPGSTRTRLHLLFNSLEDHRLSSELRKTEESQVQHPAPGKAPKKNQTRPNTNTERKKQASPYHNPESTASVNPNAVVSEENQCVICLETLKHPVHGISCSHEFCETCISVWAKTSPTCPLCREEMTVWVDAKTKEPIGAIQPEEEHSSSHGFIDDDEVGDDNDADEVESSVEEVGAYRDEPPYAPVRASDARNLRVRVRSVERMRELTRATRHLYQPYEQVFNYENAARRLNVNDFSEFMNRNRYDSTNFAAALKEKRKTFKNRLYEASDYANFWERTQEALVEAKKVTHQLKKMRDDINRGLDCAEQNLNRQQQSTAVYQRLPLPGAELADDPIVEESDFLSTRNPPANPENRERHFASSNPRRDRHLERIFRLSENAVALETQTPRRWESDQPRVLRLDGHGRLLGKR